MAATKLEGKPSIERLKDGAEKLGALFASEGATRRFDLGVKQWTAIETTWRAAGGTGCPLAPESCSDELKCQSCREGNGEPVAPTSKPAPPKVEQAHPALEDLRIEIKKEVAILAGTWAMSTGEPDDDMAEMLGEGFDTVDTLMTSYFSLGGEGCPIGGCAPGAAVRCQACVEMKGTK